MHGKENSMEQRRISFLTVEWAKMDGWNSTQESEIDMYECMYGSFSMHTDWSIQHEQPRKVYFKYSLPKFQEPPLKIQLYHINVIFLVNKSYVNGFTLRE